ncbi:hypothetical protein B4113_2755 [Geobacillus sp. B4113_201601]|nr:hypothetical protein B4113_2755 [Geobacillus sp. B4113_201601]
MKTKNKREKPFASLPKDVVEKTSAPNEPPAAPTLAVLIRKRMARSIAAAVRWICLLKRIGLPLSQRGRMNERSATETFFLRFRIYK